MPTEHEAMKAYEAWIRIIDDRPRPWHNLSYKEQENLEAQTNRHGLQPKIIQRDVTLCLCSVTSRYTKGSSKRKGVTQMAQMNQAKSEALDAKNLNMVRILKTRGFSIEFSINNRRNLFQVGAIASSRQDMQAMYFASFPTRSAAQAYANMLRGA